MGKWYYIHEDFLTIEEVEELTGKTVDEVMDEIKIGQFPDCELFTVPLWRTEKVKPYEKKKH